MSKLYFLQATLSFVKFLIGIFVPVYLYSKGFSLIMISLYAIGVSLTFLCFAPLTTRFINSFGYNISIVIGLFFYLFHLFTLQFVDQLLFFNLAWISFGVHAAFFWPAFHLEMIVFGSNKHRSSQVGTMQVIVTLVTSIAPLIGGFLLDYASYYSLMFLSFFILLVGLFPFFLSKKVRIKQSSFSFSSYLSFLNLHKNFNAKRAFLFEGFEVYLAGLFWPIVLFLLFKNSFFKLGLLFTIISLITVVLLTYLKTRLDMQNRTRVLHNVVSFLSISWFFRFLTIVLSSLFLYVSESFFKIIDSIFQLSFSSIYYNNAKKYGQLTYMMMREFFLHSGKILFALGTILLLSVFGEIKEVFYFLIFLGILIPIGLSFLREE
jgi:MFS family permease